MAKIIGCFVVGGKHGEHTNNVKQISAVEHTCYQSLLVVG